MDKKEAILEAAIQLFSERGFENTPISMVCEQIGVSKGLVFHHFKSKNELLRIIFSQTTQRIKDMNIPLSKNENPYDYLRSLIESYFTQLTQDALYLRLNLNSIVQPLTQQILRDLIVERSKIIFQSVQRIFQKMDPDSSEAKAYMFIATLDGIALNYLCIYDDYPLDKMKSMLINKYTKT